LSELREPSKRTSNAVAAGIETILTTGAGSGLGAGALAAALLLAGSAAELSAPGAVDVDEHETIPKPMRVSRIPVNAFFIEILLISLKLRLPAQSCEDFLSPNCYFHRRLEYDEDALKEVQGEEINSDQYRFQPSGAAAQFQAAAHRNKNGLHIPFDSDMLAVVHGVGQRGFRIKHVIGHNQRPRA